MADTARALAHEIISSDLMFARHCCYPTGHSDLCDRIVSALRTARNDALEEAAVAMEKRIGWTSVKAEQDCYQIGASDIRALKDRT